MRKNPIRKFAAAVLGASLCATAFAAEKPADADNFYKSDNVTVRVVNFDNQYKMKVAGNLIVPKNLPEGARLPAIIVGHPMGAVKEQSANLYAMKMAERGFVTLAIDLSFWGGSEGRPRNAVSAELYAESFSAAADYLRSLPFVVRDGIGVIGICGSGSFAISAAKIDPRLKAIATISMYDMGQASRNALRQSLTLKQRKKIIEVMWNSPAARRSTRVERFMKLRSNPPPSRPNFLNSTAHRAANSLPRGYPR